MEEIVIREIRKVGFTLWYVFSRPERISFHVAIAGDGTINSISNNPSMAELEEALRLLKLGDYMGKVEKELRGR